MNKSNIIDFLKLNIDRLIQYNDKLNEYNKSYQNTIEIDYIINRIDEEYNLNKKIKDFTE